MKTFIYKTLNGSVEKISTQKYVGSGYFSKCYSITNNTVLIIVPRRSLDKHILCKLHKDFPNNHYFPKIKFLGYGVHEDVDVRFYEMTKYKSIYASGTDSSKTTAILDDEFRRDFYDDDIRKINKTKSLPTSLKSALKKIYRYFKKIKDSHYDCCWDLHGGNISIDKNNQIVLRDPVSHRGDDNIRLKNEKWKDIRKVLGTSIAA